MENCEAMTSSTHSFAYSYGLVKKCFLKICETSKFHNFLIFQPIFIRFSLFCSENFTLSSEIKLDQLRTSPLMMIWSACKMCHTTFNRVSSLSGGDRLYRAIAVTVFTFKRISCERKAIASLKKGVPIQFGIKISTINWQKCNYYLICDLNPTKQ